MRTDIDARRTSEDLDAWIRLLLRAERRWGGPVADLATCEALMAMRALESRLAAARLGPGQAGARTALGRATGALAAALAAGPGPAAPAAGLRVLLVEDEPLNRVVLGAMFAGTAHRVDAVDDGAAAVAGSAATAYDLVLMDLRMGGMDGVTATRAIRQRAWVAGEAAPAIVALTASREPAVLRRAFEAGVDGVLAKPIGRDALLAAVARYGRLARAAR